MIKEYRIITPTRIYSIWVRNPREKEFTLIPGYEYKVRNVGKTYDCWERLKRWGDL